ncbi:MAG: S9 family peptidase [Bacteroidaceae bacterium]|nr:S9 family peptidase [Bacteroidaceae bacterium]
MNHKSIIIAMVIACQSPFIAFGARAQQQVTDTATNGYVAHVVNHNLYVEKDGKRISVSTDGSVDVVYGESVHRDEFGIEKGTFWSPSGLLLAFYRMDQSMVSTYPQVNISPALKNEQGESSSRCAVLVPDKYPMAGETSHKVTVGIFDTQTHKTIYLQAGDPTDRYFTNIAWSPDDKYIYMIELNRNQNHAELVQYDATDGKRMGVLITEDNDKYVEPLHPIRFLPWDSSKFIYLTRKDGFMHIYLYNKVGGLISQLTQGEFEVMDIVGFYPKKKQIIYTSNEQNTIGCNVYSVGLNGKRRLLGDADGWHYPKMSKDGESVIDQWSSPTVMMKKDSISLASFRVTTLDSMETTTNPNFPEIKVGTIKAADGVTDLYYRLVLPVGFDPNKKYPVVVYVYGGPHAHMVSLSRYYGMRNLDLLMARKGYVMFCLDNRGSEHRGLDFEQSTFRQLGVEEMKDQIKGVEFLKSLPYIDETRMGVHGWSFGGFMTTSLMTTYPDVFKVGVAGGPVIDWKYYEVMYGERYMDTPQTNPEGYAKTSLLNKAKNLKGRLLIIYGGNDPTCVPQHSLSFIRACIDNGTHPDLFIYPGDGHNMQTPTDRKHLEEHIIRYFDDFLK